jgi:peptidoglycan/xylan/chitin deacetylase (PgdA/CDA1 family)
MRPFGIARLVFELALIALVVVLVTRHPTPRVVWRQSVVYWVPTDQKIVALTFDDGPNPEFTPEVLDILDKYHVKATFFMIGSEMEKYPEIVKEVVARGHVIGNHTYTHPHDIELDTEAQVIRELDQCEQVIERMTGRRTHLFRPPRGLVDSTVFTIAEEEGYRTILWTVSADHHDAPTPKLMAQRVLKHIRPGGIILAHDGRFCTRWKDVAATPMIIEELSKQGYQFLTIPELLRHASPGRARVIPRRAGTAAPRSAPG